MLVSAHSNEPRGGCLVWLRLTCWSHDIAVAGGHWRRTNDQSAGEQQGRPRRPYLHPAQHVKERESLMSLWETRDNDTNRMCALAWSYFSIELKKRELNMLIMNRHLLFILNLANGCHSTPTRRLQNVFALFTLSRNGWECIYRDVCVLKKKRWYGHHYVHHKGVSGVGNSPNCP